MVEANEKLKSEVTRYDELRGKVARLTTVALTLPKMTRAEARVAFMRDLEAGRALARAELNALTRALIEKLGVPAEEWMGYLNQELEAEVQRLEQECGVSGYDEQGNPVFAQEKTDG